MAVIFMMAILLIMLAVAAPKIAEDIQRDREVETMHRGKQFTRAIQLYYRKFGSYPPSVDALVQTNQIRFLRKRYLDPTTGKDDWKPILLGQNKTPMAMGFFGEPLGLAGSPLMGGGPAPGNGIAGASTIGSAPGSNGNPVAGSDASGNQGGDGSGTSGGTDTSSGSGSGSGSGSNGSSASGFTGPTFGGGGIIGFSPASSKQSILSYKKKNHYNEWEFLYSPLGDQVGGNNNPVNLAPPLQGGAPGAAPQPPMAPTPNAPQ